ncbi:BID domain-containing T4SS effector, partial [Bartonella florencae]|uniref:BID domain-containing T4SS effector n=1 Tax=Bartonella florencae TaxID=928210 RepID=UPI0012EA8D56
MKKHQSAPSNKVEEVRKQFEQQNLGASEQESLYAKVNKPPKEQRAQQQEPIYADIDFGAKGGRAPHEPVESVYATVASSGREPSQQPEVIYADIDFGAKGGRAPHKPVESVYAEVSAGRTTPPPRTPQDEVTSKILKNAEFQYGVLEVQERCQVVYGDRYALNKDLSAILENPQAGEKILRNLMENPEDPGKLAGRTVLGIKSQGRKEAEQEFRHLCSAFEKHICQV